MRTNEPMETQKVENLKLYTLKDLEEILGVCRRTLMTYLQDGRLQGVKIGGKWKITEENLLRFVNGESNGQTKN